MTADIEAGGHLAPCPFCSSQDVSITYAPGDDSQHCGYCGGCGAFGPMDDSREEARRLWNARETRMVDLLREMEREAARRAQKE